MFKLLKKIHLRGARLFSGVSISVRLLTLMGLAASVTLLLAAMGILGLAAAKESLRTVYEDRMLPVQQLTKISELMLASRMLLQATLSEVSMGSHPGQKNAFIMDRKVASVAADAIEKNVELLQSKWDFYAPFPLTLEERIRIAQFDKSRSHYITEALLPAVVALRAANYVESKILAARTRTLYEQAGPDLQALSQLQFEAAHEAYTVGLKRHETMRLTALSALGIAILIMSWLGLMLTTSVVNPLKQVIAIFQKLSNGQYDAPITIEGKDEISKVMRSLKEMQTKLGMDEEAIHQLAFYDPLTSLPNRRLLCDRLKQALSVSERNQLYGAVLMINLDNFKSVNDSRGHEVGDRLLADVALRIQSCIRHADTVARLGGDEFIVMLVDLSPDEAQAGLLAESVGKKILAAINQPYMLAKQLQHSSACMGLCLFFSQNASHDDLLKHADSAMFQAKRSGRNALFFYDPQIQASLETRITLESELCHALPNQQFQLYYQIQRDNLQGVLGAEVLLRWEHPQYGMIFPDQFIPIAEESGLIVPIGEWVLRTACEQLKVWERNPRTADFLLAVNVSARQFRQSDFVPMVCQILAQTGINPDKLKLELTESLVLHNVVDTVAKMKALNQQGVHFSMDDFGTGYSSLSQLTLLPIQQLKIDKSFVSHIDTNHNDAVVVQTIIGMANNLGLRVIAEGVETQEQRACLERFGCTSYQGYLYGRPMPLPQFEALTIQVTATEVN